MTDERRLTARQVRRKKGKAALLRPTPPPRGTPQADALFEPGALGGLSLTDLGEALRWWRRKAHPLARENAPAIFCVSPALAAAALDRVRWTLAWPAATECALVFAACRRADLAQTAASTGAHIVMARIGLSVEIPRRREEGRDPSPVLLPRLLEEVGVAPPPAAIAAE